MTSFSIVTVVYNDITHIKETMDSIVGQSYKEVEYILIDGGSSDGTKEAILEYISSCASITKEEKDDMYLFLEATHTTYPTLTFKFLSEKDKGIYDAMNKGIVLATKEWINFINCGDKYYSSAVLEEISKNSIKKYDILYGDLHICYLDQKIDFLKKTSHDLNKLYTLFYNFGHQNCFIKTQLHKKNRFNTCYKLAADYDLVYHLYKQGCNFCFLNIVVATFISGGSTDKRGKESLREALEIALKYNVYKKNVIKIYAFYFFAKIKKTIKLHLPPFCGKVLIWFVKKINH